MNVVRPTDKIAPPLGAGSEATSADADILAMVARADADVAAGRFITVTGPVESDDLHEATMARLRARLSAGRSGR
jgi:hypothetical protein